MTKDSMTQLMRQSKQTNLMGNSARHADYKVFSVEDSCHLYLTIGAIPKSTKGLLQPNIKTDEAQSYVRLQNIPRFRF